MTDDEVRSRVLVRLDAIVSRLDEQDAAADRLTGEVDRMQAMTAASMAAGEQALTQITSLSRRVRGQSHGTTELRPPPHTLSMIRSPKSPWGRNTRNTSAST